MKIYLIGLATLTSISAFAADTYNCDITISKDGESIGKIKIEQQAGMSAGRLYTIPVSKKKNLLGKTVEEVEVVLDGLLQSGGTAADSSLEGYIRLHDISHKKPFKMEKTLLAKVQVSGDQTISSTESGFSVEGSCYLKN